MGQHYGYSMLTDLCLASSVNIFKLSRTLCCAFFLWWNKISCFTIFICIIHNRWLQSPTSAVFINLIKLIMVLMNISSNGTLHRVFTKRNLLLLFINCMENRPWRLNGNEFVVHRWDFPWSFSMCFLHLEVVGHALLQTFNDLFWGIQGKYTCCTEIYGSPFHEYSGCFLGHKIWLIGYTYL